MQKKLMWLQESTAFQDCHEVWSLLACVPGVDLKF